MPPIEFPITQNRWRPRLSANASTARDRPTGPANSSQPGLAPRRIEIDHKSLAIRQGRNRAVPKAGAAEPGMQHDDWIMIALACRAMALVAQLLGFDSDSV